MVIQLHSIQYVLDFITEFSQRSPDVFQIVNGDAHFISSFEWTCVETIDHCMHIEDNTTVYYTSTGKQYQLYRNIRCRQASDGPNPHSEVLQRTMHPEAAGHALDWARLVSAKIHELGKN